jgi:hypothetical protein
LGWNDLQVCIRASTSENLIESRTKWLPFDTKVEKFDAFVTDIEPSMLVCSTDERLDDVSKN